MEASGQTPEGTGEPQDQQEGVQAHDPSQDNPAELTQEQRAQAEQDAIKGDQGPLVQDADDAPGGPGPNTPVRTSAPDPARQPGVPLPEDRAAGVEPGPVDPTGQATEPSAAGTGAEPTPQSEEEQPAQ